MKTQAVSPVIATVIFDNGNGTILQIRDAFNNNFTNYYYSAIEAAEDYHAAIIGGNTSDWEGHYAAPAVSPTSDEINEGRYIVYTENEIAKIKYARVAETKWGNETDFFETLGCAVNGEAEYPESMNEKLIEDVEANVVFCNDGDTHLQIRDARQNYYSARYSNASEAAQYYKDAINGADSLRWNGNDDGARIWPSPEEVRDGLYKQFRKDEIAGIVAKGEFTITGKFNVDWDNERMFFVALGCTEKGE